MMQDDELGPQLHERATRGEKLTAEEERQLQNWYLAQDEADIRVLGLVATEMRLDELQMQVQGTFAHLSELTRHVQALSEENTRLRREVVELRQRVPQVLT